MCQWNPRTSVKALLPVFLLKPNFLSLANGLNVHHREGVAAREQNSFGGVHPVEQLVLRNVTRQDGPNCSRQDLLHLSFFPLSFPSAAARWSSSSSFNGMSKIYRSKLFARPFPKAAFS